MGDAQEQSKAVAVTDIDRTFESADSYVHFITFCGSSTSKGRVEIGIPTHPLGTV